MRLSGVVCHLVLLVMFGAVSQCYVLQETDMTGQQTDAKQILKELVEALRARDELPADEDQAGASDQADAAQDSQPAAPAPPPQSDDHTGTVARAGIPLHQPIDELGRALTSKDTQVQDTPPQPAQNIAKNARRQPVDHGVEDVDDAQVDELIQKIARELEARARSEWNPSERSAIVRKHNEMRRLARAADMEMLVWSSELARKAQDLAYTCVFDHAMTSWAGGTYDEVGQNLYISGNRDFNEAIDEWYNEIMYYTYGGYPPCRPGAVCGHYTQLVWAKTKEVGCGVAFCRSAWSPMFGTTFYDSYMIACNYGPQGNIEGVLPYLTGSPCSKCGGEALWCKNQLCASNGCSGYDCSCDARCVNGNLDSRTCTCNCREGYIGADCSEICEDKDHSCGPMNGWPSIWCNDPNYPYVTERCPLMCGQCTPPGGVVCQDKNHYCNANPGWDTTWCREHYVQYECPKMCGQC